MDEVWTELLQHCFHRAENKELSPISSTLDTTLLPHCSTEAHYRPEPVSLINLLCLCSSAPSAGTQVCSSPM